MSLTADDFLDFYKSQELKKVELTTMKGAPSNVLFLRGLSYAEVCCFNDLAQEIQKNKAMAMLSGEDADEQWQKDLTRSEDLLIKKAVCDQSGTLLFSDEAVFKKFRENINAKVVNEILLHIKFMNELYGGFEGQEKVFENLKKKRDASD